MARDYETSRLSGPIAGQSLTATLGERPWQREYKYSTIDEVANHYLTAMSTNAFTNNAVSVLETGVAVTSLANVLQLNGVMEGLHSIDLGILVSPIIVEYLMLIGDTHGVEYTTGFEIEEQTDEILLQRGIESAGTNVTPEDISEFEDALEGDVQEQPAPSDTSTGLMSRPTEQEEQPVAETEEITEAM